MEFPHLGQHCNEATCNRLDFLPVKCDSCDKVFCATHYNYERHNCPGAHKKNFQVPICPLCGEPVPTAPGVEPDLTVSQHIDKQCKSDSKKIYTNRCHAKGCKRKELIPVQCSQCKLNFCLRHRHTSDHDCKPATPNAASTSAGDSQGVFKIFSDTRAKAAQAAEHRWQNKQQTNPKARQVPPAVATVAQRTTPVQVQNIQGNMTEDEALAHALALSIMEQDGIAETGRRSTTSTANSQRATTVGGRDSQQTNGKDKCSLS